MRKMINKLHRIGFYGNSYIGLFVKANTKLTIMPINRPQKFSRINEILNTVGIEFTVFGSPLCGLYSIMNDNGILLSKVVQEEEFQMLKRKIKENNIDINVEIWDTEFTAISNNIVANNKKCIINPKISDKKAIEQIRNVLNVEVESIQLKRFNTVGSVITANDNGFVAHPSLTDKELDMVEDYLGIPGGISTANGGVPFVSLCIIANNNAVVFGENTTAFEQQKIIDALGFM